VNCRARGTPHAAFAGPQLQPSSPRISANAKDQRGKDPAKQYDLVGTRVPLWSSETRGKLPFEKAECYLIGPNGRRCHCPARRRPSPRRSSCPLVTHRGVSCRSLTSLVLADSIWVGRVKRFRREGVVTTKQLWRASGKWKMAWHHQDHNVASVAEGPLRRRLVRSAPGDDTGRLEVGHYGSLFASRHYRAHLWKHVAIERPGSARCGQLL